MQIARVQFYLGGKYCFVLEVHLERLLDSLAEL